MKTTYLLPLHLNPHHMNPSNLQIEKTEHFLKRVNESLQSCKLELLQNRSINRFLNRHNNTPKQDNTQLY